MKNICIINCYFGPLPEWFDLWFESAKKNEKINFLLFTDQLINKNAKNIQIEKMSLQNLSKLFSEKIKLEINIEKPYKLCDFKPTYGKVFEDYLKSYDYWGYCDLDQIFGNILEFFTDDIFDEYEKINWCGHLTFYKNTSRINNLFKEKGGAYNYKKIFCSNYNYAFDEKTGIDRIFRKNNIKTKYLNCFIDIDREYKEFLACNQKNYNKQIFYYDNGSIYQAYLDENGVIKNNEFAYIHFQTKKPKFEKIENFNNKIVVNSVGFYEVEQIDENVINTYSEANDNLFFEKREFKKNQIKKFIKMPIGKKIIRIKQGIYRNL